MMLLLKMFATFFKIGLFTFGGGYAMIPMITDEVVANGWATPQLLTDFIAISESTPGTFAINVATFVGMDQMMEEYGSVLAGIVGGAFTTLGVMMPSIIIILIIAKFFGKFSDNKYVKAFLWGVRPVVVGLILAATVSIARTQLLTTETIESVKGFFTAIDWKAVVIFAGVLVFSRVRKMHPVWYVLISGAAGAVLYGLL